MQGRRGGRAGQAHAPEDATMLSLSRAWLERRIFSTLEPHEWRTCDVSRACAKGSWFKVPINDLLHLSARLMRRKDGVLGYLPEVTERQVCCRLCALPPDAAPPEGGTACDWCITQETAEGRDAPTACEPRHHNQESWRTTAEWSNMEEGGTDLPQNTQVRVRMKVTTPGNNPYREWHMRCPDCGHTLIVDRVGQPYVQVFPAGGGGGGGGGGSRRDAGGGSSRAQASDLLKHMAGLAADGSWRCLAWGPLVERGVQYEPVGGKQQRAGSEQPGAEPAPPRLPSPSPAAANGDDDAGAAANGGDGDGGLAGSSGGEPTPPGMRICSVHVRATDKLTATWRNASKSLAMQALVTLQREVARDIVGRPPSPPPPDLEPPGPAAAAGDGGEGAGGEDGGPPAEAGAGPGAPAAAAGGEGAAASGSGPLGSILPPDLPEQSVEELKRHSREVLQAFNKRGAHSDAAAVAAAAAVRRAAKRTRLGTGADGGGGSGTGANGAGAGAGGSGAYSGQDAGPYYDPYDESYTYDAYADEAYASSCHGARFDAGPGAGPGPGPASGAAQQQAPPADPVDGAAARLLALLQAGSHAADRPAAGAPAPAAAGSLAPRAVAAVRSPGAAANGGAGTAAPCGAQGPPPASGGARQQQAQQVQQDAHMHGTDSGDDDDGGDDDSDDDGVGRRRPRAQPGAGSGAAAAAAPVAASAGAALGVAPAPAIRSTRIKLEDGLPLSASGLSSRDGEALARLAAAGGAESVLLVDVDNASAGRGEGQEEEEEEAAARRGRGAEAGSSGGGGPPDAGSDGHSVHLVDAAVAEYVQVLTEQLAAAQAEVRRLQEQERAVGGGGPGGRGGPGGAAGGGERGDAAARVIGRLQAALAAARAEAEAARGAEGELRAAVAQARALRMQVMQLQRELVEAREALTKVLAAVGGADASGAAAAAAAQALRGGAAHLSVLLQEVQPQQQQPPQPPPQQQQPQAPPPRQAEPAQEPQPQQPHAAGGVGVSGGGGGVTPQQLLQLLPAAGVQVVDLSGVLGGGAQPLTAAALASLLGADPSAVATAAAAVVPTPGPAPAAGVGALSAAALAELLRQQPGLAAQLMAGAGGLGPPFR